MYIFLEIIFARVRLEKIPAKETLVVPSSLSRMEGEMLYLYMFAYSPVISAQRHPDRSGELWQGLRRSRLPRGVHQGDGVQAVDPRQHAAHTDQRLLITMGR